MTMDRRNGMIDDLEHSEEFIREPWTEEREAQCLKLNWPQCAIDMEKDDYWIEVGEKDDGTMATGPQGLEMAHNRLLVLNGLARWQL